jgi:RND family efflux transporter MFP subunit
MASRSKGVIRFISEEGDRVRAGDPILILEDSQEKLEVNRQQKILELRTVEESDEEQLRRKDVDSPLELAEKKLNLDLAQINVEQAENLLSLRTTKAPFDGVITQRFRSAGEAADELSPVLTMVDVNNLYLECHLPAEMRNRIREGQSVSIQVDTPASAEAQGRVQLCSPVIDPASGDFEVRVLIPNAGGALMAGVRARGIIAATEQEGHQTPQSPSTSQIPAVPVTAGSP